MPKKDKSKQERSFWEWTASRFPSISGAPSTQYYLECEKSLFHDFYPELKGKKILKTDLWDEAKNTRILRWISEQGAIVFGLDVSISMVKQAKVPFEQCSTPHFIANDLQYTSFTSNSFDVIYSMGTIEHIRQYREAVLECYRILKPGGIIFLGVPNRYDPFLRPVMVSLLQTVNLYAYGYERSFSRRALEKILKDTGFMILGISGVLFMPGALRMLDLLLHVKCPSGVKLTAPLITPFAYLYRNFPSLRRHSYLICSIAKKPGLKI